MQTVGVRVVAVTCDMPSVHLSMMTALGVKLNPKMPSLQICKEKEGPPIFFIHDMCHAIKLVRNAWHFHKCIKNSKSELIKWCYIEYLYQLQNTEHLKCANKLNANHIYFNNVKMKVKFATQIFSRSVALSLKFCREELKLPQFQGSEATEEFLLIMNDIFDLMNSRTKYSNYKMRNALSGDNMQIWRSIFDKTQLYLTGLTTVSGKCLLEEDSRKTGFAAIFYNIVAISTIFSEIVTNGPMLYICTYKFSQDPLEHFFGLIRSKFGSNNNPTPKQFRNVYKRILLGVTNKLVQNSNVILQDTTEMIAIIPSSEDKVDYIIDHYDFEDLELNDLTSGFRKNVTDYIGGFIVRKVSSKLTCEQCIKSLSSMPYSGLIKTKDIGGRMTYPSKFVQKALQVAEEILQAELNQNCYMKKYFFDFINMKICNTFVSMFTALFSGLDNHCYELLKKIIFCYCSIRFKSFAKEQNEILKKSKLRSKLNKIVLFSHQ